MGEGSPGVQWMLATPIPCDATSVSPRVSLRETIHSAQVLLLKVWIKAINLYLIGPKVTFILIDYISDLSS